MRIRTIAILIRAKKNHNNNCISIAFKKNNYKNY